MTTHSETRILPYNAKQMYDLVADILSYPEFLPWCSAARIRSRRPFGEGAEIEADLVISFKVFRERFGSRVELYPDRHELFMCNLDGPFRHMRSEWRFSDVDAGCQASFAVDFEFRSPVLQKLIGVVFTEAMQRVVSAFEARAASLYGAGR